MKKGLKISKVSNNIFLLLVYIILIFIYYMYIVPFYPLPFTGFWVVISIIINLICIFTGVFILIRLIMSIVERR